MNNRKKIQVKSVMAPILVTLLVIGLVVGIKTSQQDNRSKAESADASERYVSKGLEVSFDMPQLGLVDERPNFLKISNDENSIMINRVATDFESIDEYLDSLIELNNMKVERRESKIIGDLPGVHISQVQSGEVTETYFVKKGYWVYSFSTSSEELGPQLRILLDSLKFD